jgi:hypothetical protein
VLPKYFPGFSREVPEKWGVTFPGKFVGKCWEVLGRWWGSAREVLGRAVKGCERNLVPVDCNNILAAATVSIGPNVASYMTSDCHHVHTCPHFHHVHS